MEEGTVLRCDVHGWYGACLYRQQNVTNRFILACQLGAWFLPIKIRCVNLESIVVFLNTRLFFFKWKT